MGGLQGDAISLASPDFRPVAADEDFGGFADGGDQPVTADGPRLDADDFEWPPPYPTPPSASTIGADRADARAAASRPIGARLRRPRGLSFLPIGS